MTIGRLRAVFAAEGIALALFMPFLVPLLAERGLGAVQIGLALGAAGACSLVAYPVWGALADGPLGRRRTIAVTSLTAALGGLLVLLAGDDPVLVTLAVTLASVGAMPWGPLIDALSLQELADPSAGYGRVRAWASVGWAGAAIIAGATWAALGPVPVLVAFALGSLTVGALVLSPRAAGGRDARSSGPHSAHAAGRQPRRGAGWAPGRLAAAASPVLVGFLAGVFVTSIGEHASWRFISLRILDEGGGVLLVGLAAALPALIEVPVFGSSRRLLAGLGLRRMYVAGALIAAALALVVAIVSVPWMVAAVRALDGTAYALRYMAMVVVVGALLPGSLHALGQSLMWFIYAGVAPIVADVAGGIVYERLGPAALFVAAMLAMVVGGGLAGLALRGPRFGRGASGAAMSELPGTMGLPPPV